MRVTSIYKKDKIGTLTQGGGNVSLGPSILTIGGRQYETDSTISVALPSLTASRRYQVFAVDNLGALELVISQNENSVGPSGFTSWKLVGSFMSNAASSVGFGSFLTITGVPTTLNEYEVDINSATTGFGTLGGTVRSRGFRQGNQFISTAFFTTGTITAVLATYLLPNLTIDPDGVALNNTSAANGPVIGHYGNNATTNSGYMLTATATDATRVYFAGHNASANILQPVNANVIAVGSAGFSWRFQVPILGWSNTAIEDL